MTIPAHLHGDGRIHGTMPVRCMRCQMIYKVHQVDLSQDGQESSGYCEHCTPIIFAELHAELAAREQARPQPANPATA